jgi:hypothetical protein
MAAFSKRTNEEEIQEALAGGKSISFLPRNLAQLDYTDHVYLNL